MPRTTHEAQYWEILDDNDLDIKVQLNALLTATDIGAKRLAAAQLTQALVRKRNRMQGQLDNTNPDADTAPKLAKSIRAINKDLDILKRLHRRLNVAPDEHFDQDWRLIFPPSSCSRHAVPNETDQPPSSCSRHEGPREEEGGRGMEVTENKVGYGNPPKQHQFKPGNPGGPGRPRGSFSLRSLVINELSKKNGTKTRKIVNRLIKRAIEGDVQAMLAVWRMTKTSP